MADCYATVCRLNCPVTDGLQFNVVLNHKVAWMSLCGLLTNVVVNFVSYFYRLLPSHAVKWGVTL